MPNQFPLISVIVNSYTRPESPPRAFDSVLIQAETFPDFEVIIMDDCSDDPKVDDVKKAYAEKFDAAGIKFYAVKLAENSGAQSVPKNQGIILSKGDWIRFLDDDNEFTPGSLKALYD